MRRMGGLASRIPVTYATMLLGALAMAGIPPLAPFFSKDEILGEAFKSGFYWVWGVGVVVAGLTAFYMFRLMGLVFWGRSRGEPSVEAAIHESPRTMTAPLVLLAGGTLAIGMVVGLPPGNGLLARWLQPVFDAGAGAGGGVALGYRLVGVDGALVVASVATAVAGIALAWRLFGVDLPVFGLRVAASPDRVAAVSRGSRLARFLYRASVNKWWFDELNDLVFIRVGGRAAAGLWWFDRAVVDGAVNRAGAAATAAGSFLRRIHTGRVQNYALGIAAGLIAMVVAFLLLGGR